MVFPSITAAYAAILALLYVALTLWVSAARTRSGIIHGDGGNIQLSRRIRAHANFAEYVPLILLLVALLEAGGATRLTVQALLLALLLARIMHPIGMIAPEGSARQFAFRVPGAGGTWAVMVIAALLLLLRAMS
jgi:uncharacterized membrane protein YecN with MAPEG domain